MENRWRNRARNNRKWRVRRRIGRDYNDLRGSEARKQAEKYCGQKTTNAARFAEHGPAPFACHFVPKLWTLRAARKFPLKIAGVVWLDTLADGPIIESDFQALKAG